MAFLGLLLQLFAKIEIAIGGAIKKTALKTKVATILTNGDTTKPYLFLSKCE